MARRTPSRKSKHLGNRTFGGGNTKNRRGKGNRGGVGRAGWHKHKWLRTIKNGEHLIRKLGFRSTTKKPKTVSLEKLVYMANMNEFEKTSEGFNAVLKGCKIVFAPVELKFKFNISANSFSKKAKEAIIASGGKVTELVTKKEKKPKEPKQVVAKK